MRYSVQANQRIPSIWVYCVHTRSIYVTTLEVDRFLRSEGWRPCWSATIVIRHNIVAAVVFIQLVPQPGVNDVERSTFSV